MGDRYELIKNCAYCKTENEVWYAPTCGCMTFKCVKCKKDNFINLDFKPMKIEDVKLDDVKNAFLSTTNVSWKDDEVDRICENMYKHIKDDYQIDKIQNIEDLKERLKN